MQEKLCYVNKKDKVLRRVNYSLIYVKKLRHRVVHLLIFNKKRELLLQQRSRYKKFCPLAWSSSVQGHVRYGEGYEQAAKREAIEELGIKIEPLLIKKFLYKSDIEKFIGVCIALGDTKIPPNHEEVACTKFVSFVNLNKTLKNQHVHPEFMKVIEKLFPIITQRSKK